MTQKKKNNLVRNIIIGVVAVVILGAAGKAAGWWGKDQAIKVAVDAVQRMDITETVSASGKIQPEKEVKISPDVPGEIVQLTVKEGYHVTMGQLLVKIRPDVYEAGMNRAISNVNQAKAQYSNSKQLLAQAQATFSNTEAVFKRTKQLFNDKVVSSSEFDKAKSDYEAAKASIDALKQSIAAASFNVSSNQASVKEQSDNLRKTTIFSPVSGTVSKLNVELGERVVGTSQMAGTEMMRIANMSSMEAQVDVNENDINRVAIGDTANISVDAYLGKKFKGVVFEIGSSASNTSSTTTSVDQVTNFTVKIRLIPASYRDLIKNRKDSMSAPFKPGLSCSVDIETRKAVKVLAVPIQAVTTRSDSVLASTLKPGRSKSRAAPAKSKAIITAQSGQAKPMAEGMVFVVRKGLATLIPVKTGIQNDTFISVVDGLKQDDQVITAPYTLVSKTLKDGQRVQVVPKESLLTSPK